MALRNLALPRLLSLPELFNYLLDREIGTPAKPKIVRLSSLPIAAGWDIDRFEWAFDKGDGPEADGFIVWWAQGTDRDPSDGGVLLAPSSRAYSMQWPDGEARSYGIASFRVLHGGFVSSPKVVPINWTGVA